MAELGLSQFSTFVQEVSGFPPFPWQRRLMGEVLESGWPPLLDLPTGTGKTHALLIALYALAIAPERSFRRIALVVDRRIIVDQVSDFAHRLQAALADPSWPTCREVARNLRALCVSDPDQPVRVVHLRGGIPRDDTWLGTPDQPTLIASTVDQVGSRLLFRGYGVSEGMRPVHAGVLARDTLYLLDEVHLATAFEETLGRLEGTYADWPEHQGTGRRLRVVRMSATPRDAAKATVDRFGLDDEDRAHPVLSRRLNAARPATLEVIKTTRATDRDAVARNRQRIAQTACARALEATASGAKAVGVVLNRIDTARRTAQALRAHPDAEVVLLTGRMRPFDKSARQADITRIAGAGVEHPEDARPAIIVATSCIEAGADLDFDALVTEVASLDALRQRFGRLDRLGRYPQTWAWVLGRKDQLARQAKPDPIYGTALRNTWNYLTEIAEDGRVDFGLSAFPIPEAERLEDLLPPSPEAPVLFPSYLDMWSETRPAPHPDPDVALWLHGKDQAPERDVHVVFRADLPPASTNPNDRALATEALEFLPPVADEAVAAPLHEVESWLGESVVWRWTAEGVQPVPVRELHPGDTVVVDAQSGGLRHGTWDPDSTEPVTDVADPATLVARGLAKLRLDPRCIPEGLEPELPRPPSTEAPERLEDARAECLTWLDGLTDRLERAPEDWHPVLRALARPEGRRRLVPAASGAGSRIWRVMVIPDRRAVEATTEEAISVFTGVEVTLSDHLHDVEAWAGAFARTAGLEPRVAEDVALAALLHDIGKADPRFQAMLHGGDPITAASGSLLAKSRQHGSAAARARARRRSGWPPGLRHELVSLALLDASPELRVRAHDLDLVRHLVASHHGWCRPWAPATIDPAPTRVRTTVAGVDVEVTTAAVDDTLTVACTSRFRRLCRRYGWHGLAYLEALLRLGDHRASSTPGTRPGGTPP